MAGGEGENKEKQREGRSINGLKAFYDYTFPVYSDVTMKQVHMY